MTDLQPDLRQRPSDDRQATALPSDLTTRELARWSWRQLTSMRTALVLLLLLALAAIPGSVIPQENIDSLAVSQWRDDHPRLAPIWDRLDLFSVYGSVWFAAIYILLMISLVGCIIPRLFVYYRAMRAKPPKAPRHLSRLPESTSYTTDEDPDAVLARAARVMKGRRFRVHYVEDESDAVAAERGYLREAGNLVFHLAVIVVLVGVAAGSLFGYKGGVILLNGTDYGFSNNLTQYDDFAPGALFDPDVMEPFSFSITDFDVDWLTEGERAGMAREFVAKLDYTTEPGGEDKTYDLKVNHPLSIGGTDVFLIGHGYAPVITIRDGEGNVAKSGPVVFLPTNAQTFESFGVVKAPFAKPGQIGLEGAFYPTFAMGRDADGNLTMPASVFGEALDPLVSLSLWTGDLGLDDGIGLVGLRPRQGRRHPGDEAQRPAVPHGPASRRDRDAARRPRHGDVRRPAAVEQDPGQPQPGFVRRALRGRRRAPRPAGLALRAPAPDVGARAPAGRRHHARRGRPPRPVVRWGPGGRRRRARGGRGSLAGGDGREDRQQQGGRVVTDAQWEVFSYEAVIGAAVLYFLAMLAYFFELASLRTASKEVETVSVGADGGGASHAVAVDQEPAPSRRSEVAGRLGSRADRLRRRSCTSSPSSRVVSPPTPTGCRGATCTSSRSRAPSWSR